MKLWTDKKQKDKTGKGQEMKEIQYEIVKGNRRIVYAKRQRYTKEINLDFMEWERAEV